MNDYKPNVYQRKRFKCRFIIRLIEFVLCVTCLILLILIICLSALPSLAVLIIVACCACAFIIATAVDLISMTLAREIYWTSWIPFAVAGGLIFFFSAGLLFAQSRDKWVLILVAGIMALITAIVFLLDLIFKNVLDKRTDVAPYKTCSSSRLSTPTEKITEGATEYIECEQLANLCCLKSECPKRIRMTQSSTSYANKVHASKEVSTIPCPAKAKKSSAAISKSNTGNRICEEISRTRTVSVTTRLVPRSSLSQPLETSRSQPESTGRLVCYSKRPIKSADVHQGDSKHESCPRASNIGFKSTSDIICCTDLDTVVRKDTSSRFKTIPEETTCAPCEPTTKTKKSKSTCCRTTSPKKRDKKMLVSPWVNPGIVQSCQTPDIRNDGTQPDANILVCTSYCQQMSRNDIIVKSPADATASPFVVPMSTQSPSTAPAVVQYNLPYQIQCKCGSPEYRVPSLPSMASSPATPRDTVMQTVDGQFECSTMCNTFDDDLTDIEGGMQTCDTGVIPSPAAQICGGGELTLECECECVSKFSDRESEKEREKPRSGGGYYGRYYKKSRKKDKRKRMQKRRDCKVS